LSDQLDAPCNEIELENPCEIEVTDPTHPLFGRHFPLLYTSSTLTGPGYAWVAYQGFMRLRIPLAATNLVLSRPRFRAKFSRESIEELLTLARESEVLCPLIQKTSGPACPTNSASKSLPTS
jgi:hypothetical protein